MRDDYVLRESGCHFMNGIDALECDPEPVSRRIKFSRINRPELYIETAFSNTWQVHVSVCIRVPLAEISIGVCEARRRVGMSIDHDRGEVKVVVCRREAGACKREGHGEAEREDQAFRMERAEEIVLRASNFGHHASIGN